MRVRQTECESCGAGLVWINGLDHRPLEAAPVATLEGGEGYVVHVRNGVKEWARSCDHPEAAEHLRVHRCRTWLTERSESVPSVGEMLNGSLTATTTQTNRHPSSSQAQPSKLLEW